MLPDQTVVLVIAIVLLLATILNQLLFKPLMKVMNERRSRVADALALASESSAKATAAQAEATARIQAAGTEVYRGMDERRKDAMNRRGEILAKTREDVHTSMTDASARIEQQTADARTRLDASAGALADAIVERILGRKAS